MNTIVTAVPWLACTCSAGLAVSGYIRMAKAGGWRDAGAWHAPLVFTSGTMIALAFLGMLGPVTGAFLAVAPLIAVAWTMGRTWKAIAAEHGHVTAAQVVLAVIAGRLRDALRDARTGLRPPGEKPVPSASPAGRPPAWSAPVRARNVPHLLDDPNLGAHPHPADIAAGLEHADVPVPPHWDRLAQIVSDFEPEDDDDMSDHMAGEAAGVLSWSAAIENRAEHLAVRGLDPILIEAHYNIAEAAAELVTSYALLVRRDHVLHGDLREWRDNGGVLPHGARQYWDAGSPGDGGHAA